LLNASYCLQFANRARKVFKRVIVVGQVLAETVEGTLPTETGGAAGEGDAENGKAVFASAGCGGCHTLADANAGGSIGPNLDDVQPSEEAVAAKVRVGGGGMPAFEGQLSDQEIQDVAAYVSSVAGG
jgi:mono/diheme cytochrome c family protein